MCKEKKTTFNLDAPAFTPASATPPARAMVYDGTDEGAISKEYFVVEGPCQNFRTILPHGHIVYDMYGRLTNISYTARNGTKIGTVATPTHWATIRADSIPIHDGLAWYAAGCP
jgi:hypothetical protein